MNALLISPEFFDYAAQMQNAIERQGVNCVRIDEKPSNTSIAKIIIRLFGQKRIVKKVLFKNLKSKVDYFNAKSFDYIIVIKAECVSDEFMSWLRTKYSSAKFIFYAWDSIKNYPHVENLLQHFDLAYSFDHNDSMSYKELKHLPLFYSPHYKKNIEPSGQRKISFVGSYHSDRFHVLQKILEKYKGIYDLNFTLYFPSILMLASFIIKNGKYAFSKKDGIKFTLKPMSGEEIVTQYNQSVAVVDIHHPHQNGLTMRVIELLPLERKIITTNESVKSYSFYNENNICVINRDDPQIDLGFIEGDFHSTDTSFINSYSIDSWAKKLLSF